MKWLYYYSKLCYATRIPCQDHDADGPAAAHPLPVVLQGPAAFPTLLSSPGPSKYLGLIVWLITFD